jgi:glycosyltransferase involved in cell wall biosynthesis
MQYGPRTAAETPIRVGVVCDFVEEGWASMDLVGEMLVRELQGMDPGLVAATPLRPAMIRAATRIPALRGVRAALNADRLANRHLRYPAWLRRHRRAHDVFHVVDHSYAHLVHSFPAGRTLVTCHDLDAFRCLLDPAGDPRGAPFRAMTRRILAGLQAAGRVVCDSRAVADELLAHGIVERGRVEVVPLGVSPEFSPSPDPEADREAERLLGPRGAAMELVNVGSTVPRKRIDLLLRVFAAVRGELPVRLVRAGGPFTPPQRQLARRLGVEGEVAVLPFLDRRVLAAVYRRAALVLQPSEREGFGLPLVEALACGARVVASDLPVLREVGGGAVTFAAAGDEAAWTDAVLARLREPRGGCDAGVRHARAFSWAEYGARMLSLYRSVLRS